MVRLASIAINILLSTFVTKSTTMTMPKKCVSMHWFRKGLRLHDNPALLASIDLAKKSTDGRVYPVYILDGDCYQLRHCSALRANFLVECLADLDQSLRAIGSRLYVVSGDPVEVLPELWRQFAISHMTWEADETGEPYALKRDTTILNSAKEHDIEVQLFSSETLHPLKAYQHMAGGISALPKSMSTFSSLLYNMGDISTPLNPPKEKSFPTDNNDDPMEGCMLPPKSALEIPWPRDIPKSEVTPIWNASDCDDNKLTPIVRGGETNGLAQLKRAMAKPTWVATFEKPKTSCTSLSPSTCGISPYMSLGCLSPRTVWYAVQAAIEKTPANVKASKPPVSLHGQLMWRDFNNLMAYSANQQNPGSWGRMEGNPYCRQIPWEDDESKLSVWKKGQTGYPWIDACMTQLATEGWIHHLGRHAVACFLTRGDLWQSWEKGAQHFESELLDADYALNNFNWLWLSCSGFFYQYFRCYSPVSFQKKNDPHGAYIRKWLPQLAQLPDKYIYEPWKAPVEVQMKAGVRIGKDYPQPIVEHTPVSKENMSKISAAYDMAKATVGKKGKAGQPKQTKKTKARRKDDDEVPTTKKSRQTKLKFTK